MGCSRNGPQDVECFYIDSCLRKHRKPWKAIWLKFFRQTSRQGAGYTGLEPKPEFVFVFVFVFVRLSF